MRIERTGLPNIFSFSWPIAPQSVRDSSGYTCQYLVFGYELSLTLDLMLSLPQSAEPDNLHDWVLQKQNAFRKAFLFVRRNATAQQRRRDILYNKHVHGLTYKEGEHVLLHYPVVPVGKSPKLASPRRGPYQKTKCLNDVNYQIKNLPPTKSKLFIMIAWNDIIDQNKLCLMSRHTPLPTLLVIRLFQSPTLINDNVAKLFYLSIFHHKCRLLPQLTAQFLLQFRFLLLFWMFLLIAPPPPPHFFRLISAPV